MLSYCPSSLIRPVRQCSSTNKAMSALQRSQFTDLQRGRRWSLARPILPACATHSAQRRSGSDPDPAENPPLARFRLSRRRLHWLGLDRTATTTIRRDPRLAECCPTAIRIRQGCTRIAKATGPCLPLADGCRRLAPTAKTIFGAERMRSGKRVLRESRNRYMKSCGIQQSQSRQWQSPAMVYRSWSHPEELHSDPTL